MFAKEKKKEQQKARVFWPQHREAQHSSARLYPQAA